VSPSPSPSTGILRNAGIARKVSQDVCSRLDSVLVCVGVSNGVRVGVCMCDCVELCSYLCVSLCNDVCVCVCAGCAQCH